MLEAAFIFTIAAAYAMLKGVGSGAKAIRQKYRDHIEPKRSLVRDAISQGHAGASVKVGEKAGALAAASVTGLGLAFRAFGSGMKAGWSQGKTRGREIIDRHKPAEPVEVEQDPTPVDKPTESVDTKPDSTPASEESVEKAQPEPQRPLALVTTINPVKEGQTMAIATHTGGEVLTREQFEGEMKGVIDEATSELEDAQGDAKRAVEDTNRVEMISSCMASLSIDPGTVASVRVLSDTNSARIENARARVAAAEQRKAAAEKALATFMASAQKNFYAS